MCCVLRSAALCKNLGNVTMGPVRSEVLQVVKRATIVVSGFLREVK